MSLLDRGVSTQYQNELARAYLDWIPTLTTRADLTLRCRANVTGGAAEPPLVLILNEDLIAATIVRALNRINGRVLGASRRAGPHPRLDALVWTERGRLTGRPHAHALIERPVSWEPTAFAALVTDAWHAQPFGHDQVRVDEVRDLRRSLGYNAKADPRFGNIVYFHKEPDATAWWRPRGSAACPELENGGEVTAPDSAPRQLQRLDPQ